MFCCGLEFRLNTLSSNWKMLLAKIFKLNLFCVYSRRSLNLRLIFSIDNISFSQCFVDLLLLSHMILSFLSDSISRKLLLIFIKSICTSIPFEIVDCLLLWILLCPSFHFSCCWSVSSPIGSHSCSFWVEIKMSFLLFIFSMFYTLC